MRGSKLMLIPSGYGYLHSYKISSISYFICELWVLNLKKEKMKMNKLLIITIYTNDAMYHAHPYTLSTTVLGD